MRKNPYSAKSVKFRCAKNRICINYKRSTYKKLNFSMIEHAYIQIIDSNQHELVSFPMSDYYESVTSMMIGEIYLHNGIWKFHAVGNGVKEDLAGLCRRYGVNVS